ncbi:MAG: hypothetical protein IPO92_11785 [Saprospiraceae bacterium]|nr:hypothetical protein [Saprospiraceae bacterium]
MFKYNNKIIENTNFGNEYSELTFATKITGQKSNNIFVLGSDKKIYHLNEGVLFDAKNLKDIRILALNNNEIILGAVMHYIKIENYYLNFLLNVFPYLKVA